PWRLALPSFSVLRGDIPHRIVEHLAQPVQQIERDGQRRHYDYHIAKRSQQNGPIAAAPADLPADTIPCRATNLLPPFIPHLAARQSASRASVVDEMQVSRRDEGQSELVERLRDRGQAVAVFQKVEVRQGDGTPERVAGVGVAVEEGAPCARRSE